jgi:hypothetical protein
MPTMIQFIVIAFGELTRFSQISTNHTSHTSVSLCYPYIHKVARETAISLHQMDQISL